jgi:hypothetical protein
MGFELTTSVFERAKTGHALDRTATVIDFLLAYSPCFEKEMKVGLCDHHAPLPP